MAYSRVVAEGDGVTTQFAVNFALDFLLEADVTCRVGTEADGGGDPIYRDITFLSTNLLEVAGAPAGDGVQIVFERTVPKDNLRVDFSNGDTLDEDNLTIAQKQAMMAVHEIADGRFSVLTEDLDMGGFKVVNHGTPTDPTDGVTKAYVDANNSSTEAAAAQAAQAAAEAAATQAEDADASAAVHEAAALAAVIAAEDARDAAIDAAESASLAGTTYDTRAIAAAAIIAPEVNFIRVLGYTFGGDTGGRGMLFERLGDTPSPVRSWHLQNSVDSSYWQLTETEVNPRMFGAAGDDTTDDYAAFQDAIDYQSEFNDGGDVCGVGDDVYKIVIDSSTPEDGVSLKQRVNLLGRGSASIRMYCDAYVYGIRPLGYNKIKGWKLLEVASSTGLASTQAIWHSAITFGVAYGDQGTVADPNLYMLAQSVEIAWNTLHSVRDYSGNGVVVGGFGGMHDIHIHRNIFKDNATLSIAIGFDWSFFGALSSFALDDNKTAYNAGTMYSVHPHNIVIEHNHIGRMTMTSVSDPFGGMGIRMSGGYNYKLLNNDIEESEGGGIFITGGDCSFEYAPADVRKLACMNIVVEGNILRECNRMFGIYYEAFPDNVYGEVVAATYTNMFTHDGYRVNTRIVGNHVHSTFVTGHVWYGIYVRFSRGGLVADNHVSGFFDAIAIGQGAVDIKVYNNHATLAEDNGIRVGSSSVPYPYNTHVKGNFVYKNGLTYDTEGGIALTNCNRTVVERNHLGEDTEAYTLYPIKVATGAKSTSIVGNIVQSVKTGGSAFLISSTSDVLWMFRDNEYLGPAGYFSGGHITPVERFGMNASSYPTARYVANAAGMSGNTPSTGTYVAGDIIDVRNPASAGVARSLCVTGGTPGTWATLSTRP